MIQKHTLVVGPFQCNCSVLVCAKTKEAIVIDAGDEFDRIKAWVESQGASVKYSVHTHAHLDHIGAVEALKKWRPQTKICLHKADEGLYKNLAMQGQLFGIKYDSPPPIDQFIEHEEVLKFGDHKFSVIHTPGHSPGGVCLRFEGGELAPEPVVFSGDTLFQQSIGRTDLWGADHGALIRSIKDRLLTLDEQTRVYPGHGPATTIAVEARENPFL
ncbi:MAG: MBL fold metallo-hydrolase [Deltaproteobacteria bacterium]|nr:MBL fold metallo-hydrolase [Deltaproteobacteria bacterium]